MISSARESKEMKPLSPPLSQVNSLMEFAKSNKDKPAVVAEVLLAAFASPDSRVAFALDELSEKEKEVLMDATDFPLPLKVYYAGYKKYGELYYKKYKDRDEFNKVVFNAAEAYSPQFLHALRARIAVHTQDYTLFWALLKHNKQHINLADCIIKRDSTEPEEYDLSGLNLKKCILYGHTLKLNLSDADLIEADIYCSHFDGSSFYNAKLDSLKLGGSVSYTNFQGANLSEEKQNIFFHGPLFGTDFRGASLSEKQKERIKVFFKEPHPCFSPIERYLYSKKDKIDFDAYVFGMLLIGAKSKKEFAEKMLLIPDKLKTKKNFLGMQRPHSFWTMLKKVLKKMPDVVIESVEKIESTFANRITDKDATLYVPVRLAKYTNNYPREIIPSYIAKIIIDAIKKTSFMHPSYQLIEHADVDNFIPSIALKDIQLAGVTRTGIEDELIAFAGLKQMYPRPKEIIQSIEALRAVFYITNRSTLESTPITTESKLPITTSSSSMAVVSKLTNRASLESALNRHPLYEEVFKALDERFNRALHFSRELIGMGKARKDQEMLQEGAIRYGEGCAKEIIEIWTYKQTACLSGSSTETAAKSSHLKDEAKAYGYDCKHSKNENNDFFQAITDQLQYFPKLRDAVEKQGQEFTRKKFKTLKSQDGLNFASLTALIVPQLVNLLGVDVISRTNDNHRGVRSISKSIYMENWGENLILIALAKTIRANIIILNCDGKSLRHIENVAFPTLCLGHDGDNYYSLHRNDELKPTKSLPIPTSTPSVSTSSQSTPSVLDASFFGGSMPAISTSSTAVISSVPVKKL